MKRLGPPEIHYYQWRLNVWLGSETRDRLNAAGIGIYRELLDHCYKQGSFPDDPVWIARRTNATVEEVASVMPVLEHNFYRDKNDKTRLRNKLADLYRNQYFSFVKGQSDKGKLKTRKSKDVNVVDRLALTEPEVSLNRASTEPLVSLELASANIKDNIKTIERNTTQEEEGVLVLTPSVVNGQDNSSLRGIVRTVHEYEPEAAAAHKQNQQDLWFETFWSIVWAKIGRGAARAAFRKAATTSEKAGRIIEAARAQGPLLRLHSVNNGHSVVHPSTWLNQQRWEDDIEDLRRDTNRSAPIHPKDAASIKAVEKFLTRHS